MKYPPSSSNSRFRQMGQRVTSDLRIRANLLVAKLTRKRPVENVRHLQTFYYVARNGGISRSIGRMPYGIMQPAISEQMKLLEESLGFSLFVRNPFQLTSEGLQLFEQIAPFCEYVDTLDPTSLQSQRSVIRIAADELFIQHVLPKIARFLSRAQPQIQLSFRSGSSSEMYQWLLDGEMDLVVGPLACSGLRGLSSKRMFELPLVLLVDAKSTFTSAADFWTTLEITHPLVCPGSDEVITQVFRRGLQRGGLHWTTSLSTPSIGSVAAYVANTDHVGLSLGGLPNATAFRLRELPLPGFDPIEIGVQWSSTETARLRNVLAAFRFQRSPAREPKVSDRPSGRSIPASA